MASLRRGAVSFKSIIGRSYPTHVTQTRRRLTSISQIRRRLIVLPQEHTSVTYRHFWACLISYSWGRGTYLFCRKCILLDAPPVTEAVGQLKDGQDKFPLGGATLLQPGLKSDTLDVGSVLGGCGQVEHCLFGFRFTAPAMPTSTHGQKPIPGTSIQGSAGGGLCADTQRRSLVDRKHRRCPPSPVPGSTCV